MPYHDEERVEEKTSYTGTLAWFMAGAAVGAAIGILFAPRCGRETREIIGRKVEETRNTGSQWLEQAGSLLDGTRDLVEDAVDLFERGRKLAQGA